MIKKMLSKFWKPSREINPKRLRRKEDTDYCVCGHCGGLGRLQWVGYCAECYVDRVAAHECRDARNPQ
jgi:hypothetical protein